MPASNGWDKGWEHSPVLQYSLRMGEALSQTPPSTTTKQMSNSFPLNEKRTA